MTHVATLLSGRCRRPTPRGAGFGLDLSMRWSAKLGNDLVAEGLAKPRPPAAYKIVGSERALW